MHFYRHVELIQSLFLHNWAFKNKEILYLLFTTLKVSFKAWFDFFVRNYLIISLLSNGLNQLSLILSFSAVFNFIIFNIVYGHVALKNN